jgi:uncharacterized membrane protein YGL010W
VPSPLLADYATKHTDKTNLAIHFLSVPPALGAILLAAAFADRWAAVGLAGALLVIQLLLDPPRALLFAPILAALAAGAWYVAPLMSWKLGGPLAVVALLGAIAAQGAGHQRELVRTKFTGPHHFLYSILREQMVLAPLFLASIAR